MSLALYSAGGLRFWTEDEIRRRAWLVSQIKTAIEEAMRAINAGWVYRQIEGPTLVLRQHVHESYDSDDVFTTTAKLAGEDVVLRPETTATSYAYARHLLNNGMRAPLCVWQVGTSYRRETNDGASPSKLRYNAFNQLEFQHIYPLNTKADYFTAILPIVRDIIQYETRAPVSRIIQSDRLPAYSSATWDIEIPHRGKFKEMASCSLRTDFSHRGIAYHNLGIAIGIDRLLDVVTGPLADPSVGDSAES